MSFFTGQRIEPKANEGEPVSLEESYQQCSRLARKSSSNFYMSFWLLPPAQRKAMCALYAFARHSDDLADSQESTDARRAALTQWREAFTAAQSGQTTHPLLPAVMDAVERFAIPTVHLEEIIRGVEMDLDQTQYDTFEDLHTYCYRVASSVGLACLSIWGFDPSGAQEPAIRCGLAFQLTNILRDLREDAALGRVYLPQEDFERFGFTPGDLQAGFDGQEFIDMMTFQVDRAESFYRDSEPLFAKIQPPGRRMLRMMHGVYRKLLHRIGRQPERVLTERVSLPYLSKLWIAAKSLR